MILLPLSGISEMRHMLVVISRHPRTIVSPLKVSSHPCMWKKTSQPASHSTETERRLLVRVGALWASRAALGSLDRRRSSVLVVNIRLPAG